MELFQIYDHIDSLQSNIVYKRLTPSDMIPECVNKFCQKSTAYVAMFSAEISRNCSLLY